MVHMQYAGTTAGSVAVPGSWEMAVPNGLYSVKVDVGDAGTAVDSSHWINIENQNAIAAFTPATGSKFATATRVVAVEDGRITLSPVGGTNTKITYVDIASVEQAGRPYSEVVLPANGTIDVVTNVSPTASNELPGGAVSPTTVATGVRLTRVSDGVAVPGVGATSGGGDTVSFRPDETLLPSTLYRFDVLETTTDTSGNKFFPFSSVFTTRADSTNPGTVSAAFDKTDAGAAKGKAYTSLAFGPDGKLYAGTIFGQIYRFDVGADGTLSNMFEINTVRTHASASRLGRCTQPHRDRPGLRPGVDAHQPDPVDHRQLRLPGLRRAGQHRRDLPAERPEPPELPGGHHQHAAVHQGPRDQLARLPQRQALRDPGLDERHGRHRRHLEAARAPAVRGRARARPRQAAGQPAGRRLDARHGQGAQQQPGRPRAPTTRTPPVLR